MAAIHAVRDYWRNCHGGDPMTVDACTHGMPNSYKNCVSVPEGLPIDRDDYVSPSGLACPQSTPSATTGVTTGKPMLPQSLQNSVVSVVLGGGDDTQPLESPCQEVNARGTLGSCPPRPAESFQSFSESSEVVLGVDNSDEGVIPDALRLLSSVGHPQDDPYLKGGPWAYADDEKLGGRVFLITQNAQHLGTGRTLMTPDQLGRGVDKKGMHRWAWVLHDKDLYTTEEAEKLPCAVAGQPKADHYHVVVERGAFATVGTIARAFGVPPQCVEKKPQGAFLDMVEYLTHEHPNQQVRGKYLYPDDAVKANFDWRAELTKQQNDRGRKTARSGRLTDLDRLCLRVLDGELTRAEAKEADPEAYVKGLHRVRQARFDYLTDCPAPDYRLNALICGVGGIGKDLAGLGLAGLLASEEVMLNREPVFVIGGDNVTFENWDGQPGILWSDVRAIDMLTRVGGRSTLFSLLDPFPNGRKVKVNVKGSYVQLGNRFNIVTGPEDHITFLDGLAGQYKEKNGVLRQVENKSQSYRRFPIIIPMTDDTEVNPKPRTVV